MDQNEYVEHITGAVVDARNDIENIMQQIAALDPSAMECVDEFNNIADPAVDIAGTIWFFYYEGYLPRLLEILREAGKTTLEVGYHWYCGYLYTVMGLTSLSDQLNAIATAAPDIERMAEVYGITILWQAPDQQGTAAPYMTA